MPHKPYQLALFGLLLIALPAWTSQQKPQPPAGAPPASSGPAGPAPASPSQAAQSADTAPDRVTADEDIDVGLFYMHKGDQDAAIPRFEDAIRKQPKLAKPRLLLAEAYEKKGDKASAAKCYKEYLQAFPHASDGKKIQKKIDKLTSQ
jgi:tetratricopeptide (TPR) repeat protein